MYFTVLCKKKYIYFDIFIFSLLLIIYIFIVIHYILLYLFDCIINQYICRGFRTIPLMQRPQTVVLNSLWSSLTALVV